MSKEEVTLEDLVDNVEDTVENDVVDQYEESEEQNPIELEAMDQGWVPKDEFIERGGDPNDWRDARWFLDRGDLLHQLKSLRGELSRTKQGIEALKEHNSKLAKKESDQLKLGLKRQYQMALDEGDSEKAAEINDWLMELKVSESNSQKVESQNQPEVSGPSQAWVSWIKENPWYSTKPDLREEADDYGKGVYNSLLMENGGQPLSEDQISQMGKKVSRYIKRIFPNEFKNESRSRQSTVMGSSTTTRGKKGKKTKGFTMNDIPEDMRPAAESVMSTGVFKNLDEYVSQLLTMPDVKKRILGE